MIHAEDVKSAISCRQFAEQIIGLRVNRSGFACCPFHQDKTASLKIYGNDDCGWYCYGCHAGGDIITMAQLYYGMSFGDTLRQLNADFNLNLGDADSGHSTALLRAVRRGVRKSSAEQQKRQDGALESKYWACYDRWLQADRKVAENEPAEGEFPSDEYIRASWELEKAKHDLEYLEVYRTTVKRG